MRKNHSTLTNDAVVKDLQCKFYQHSYLCAAWSWPRCYVCVCMLYVYSLCIFVSLRVTAREWPILVSKGHSVHPPDATFPVEAMHSCLLPQISIPSDPMEQRDRVTLRTCACTHTHTCKHAGRPGSDKVPGSQDRGLDGKMHSFTCCFFQISIIVGLFWLLMILEFTPKSHTNSNWPEADLRFPMLEGEQKGLVHLLLWDQLKEDSI